MPKREYFQDIDVVIAAHGAGDDSVANRLVRTHARRIERALPGSRAMAAYVRGVPSHREALARADRATCVVVPLFTSEGYYTTGLRCDVVKWASSARSIVVPPIGASSALHNALGSCIWASVRKRGLAHEHTRVLIVGHGTRRHGESGDITRYLARRLGLLTGLECVAAFLDDDPCIEVAVARLPVDVTVIVVPFLLGGGTHAGADVPNRVMAAADRAGISHRSIVILDSLGELPTLHHAIVGSVRQALAPSVSSCPDSGRIESVPAHLGNL